MSNKLLMNYRCDTATGRFLQASYSLFLVELGISFQPLQESYSKYGFLSTHSWMKMLRKKISMFGVKILVADLAMEYPWEKDWFVMQLLFEMATLGRSYRDSAMCASFCRYSFFLIFLQLQ
jgi:hypothetical protein